MHPLTLKLFIEGLSSFLEKEIPNRQTLPPQTKTITKIVFQKLITSLLIDIQLGGPSTNWTDPFEEARTYTFCGIRPFFRPRRFLSPPKSVYI